MGIERKISWDGERLVIDFSNCKLDLSVNYNGANGKKACIIYNDEKYMIKSSGHAKDNPDMHYSNSCISEYVCCNIIDALGYNVQKTLLGNFKGKLVVACKDFREDGEYIFYDFASLKNNIVFSSTNGTDTELNEVLTTINEQNIIQPEELKEFFWDQFIVDSFIGNFDRHNGNWGYLYNIKSGLCKPAPIFDCGSCMYPQLTDEQMENILNNQAMIDERVYTFPNSALKDKGVKINYYNFLNITDNVDCINALKRFQERLDFNKVKDVVKNTPYISDVYKKFLCTMLENRYNKIILASLSKNINIEKSSLREDLRKINLNKTNRIKSRNNDLER